MHAIINAVIIIHASGMTHWHGDNLVMWCVAVTIGFAVLILTIARGE